ncbi:MAG: prephenate dehydrogenase [Anaerolineales bacterium]|nr:prephenate dehydrogenase [Anaerolineales bacterium]
MAVQITIIGLGQVGSSIGLALAGQTNIKRVGHDKNFDVGRASQKAGAVDEFKINLPSSVSSANVVILSLPLSEIRDTLGYIAQDLQEGTVILDTAPAKTTVAAWVSEQIPQGRYYIGLSPAVGADYLHGIELGVASARADLFKNGLFLVNAPLGTPEEALRLATDLVALLGARSVLTDSVEADGLLAAAHLLPQLAGAALLDATVSQPGWTEARKVAARPYASVTAAMAYHDEAKSLSNAALANSVGVVRMIDSYIASLVTIRDRVANSDAEGLTTLLEDAVKSRDRWLNERSKADWEAAQESSSESFGNKLSRLFVGNMFAREKKKK